MDNENLGLLLTEVRTDIKWMRKKQEASARTDILVDKRIASLETTRTWAKGGVAVIGLLTSIGGVIYKFLGGS
tara:strand:+ start:271 stop:489 length:219 start_codon:yes stop_codon:yes gene_type:complete